MEQESIQEKLARERTILAAERTFAAWIRTGLAGFAGGLVIIKLVPFKSDTNQILAYIAGLLLILWGIFIIIINYINYSQHLLYLKPAKWYLNTKVRMQVITFLLLLISFLILIVSYIHIFHL